MEHGVEILTVTETAKFMRCSKETVRRAERDGQLPGFRVGRRVLFRKQDLVEWVQSQSMRKVNARKEEEQARLKARVELQEYMKLLEERRIGYARYDAAWRAAERGKGMKSELPDYIVANMLGMSVKDAPRELLEAKRLQLLLHRELKQLNERGNHGD